MNWVRGVCASAIVFVLLFLLFTPKVYSRIEGKAEKWTETFVSPIWSASTAKYTVFQIPNGTVIVAQEDMAEFQSLSMSRGFEPKPLPHRVPITERGYVFRGFNLTVLAGYLLLAIALGTILSISCLAGLVAAGVCSGVGLAASAGRLVGIGRRTEPPSPGLPSDTVPQP